MNVDAALDFFCSTGLYSLSAVAITLAVLLVVACMRGIINMFE